MRAKITSQIFRPPNIHGAVRYCLLLSAMLLLIACSPNSGRQTTTGINQALLPKVSDPGSVLGADPCPGNPKVDWTASESISQSLKLGYIPPNAPIQVFFRFPETYRAGQEHTKHGDMYLFLSKKRKDNSFASFMICIIPTLSNKQNKPFEILNACLESTKLARNKYWSCSKPECGTINGIKFYRQYWLGENPEFKKMAQGVVYVGVYKEYTFILSSQDLKLYSSESLDTAEKVFSTFSVRKEN